MRVVTKQELAQMPPGTVFSEWKEKVLGDVHIKTSDKLVYGDGRVGWNGELVVDDPDIMVDNKDNKILYTCWMTTDNADIDYDDDQLFAIWDKNEIERMINCLMWALYSNTDREIDFDKLVDMDHWTGSPDGKLLTDKEIDERAW